MSDLETPPEDGMVLVGVTEVDMSCASCPEHFPIAVATWARVVPGGDESGRDLLRCAAVPDMTDAWAHAWTHEQ